jgi:hypothetical protein
MSKTIEELYNISKENLDIFKKHNLMIDDIYNISLYQLFYVAKTGYCTVPEIIKRIKKLDKEINKEPKEQNIRN